MEDKQFTVSVFFRFVDLVKTFQFAGNAGKNLSHGASYNIVYMANDTSDPHQTCFQSNGTKETEIAIQAVLPHITHFTVILVNLDPKLSVVMMFNVDF